MDNHHSNQNHHRVGLFQEPWVCADSRLRFPAEGGNILCNTRLASARSLLAVVSTVSKTQKTKHQLQEQHFLRPQITLQVT